MEKIVEELRVKLRYWIRTALAWQITYYACGIMGGVSSCYAASPYQFARGSAVIAGACFAVLGFARPLAIYHKFMSASRILQNALYEYDIGKIDGNGLLDANRRAENYIETVDEKVLPTDGKG